MRHDAAHFCPKKSFRNIILGPASRPIAACEFATYPAAFRLQGQAQREMAPQEIDIIQTEVAPTGLLIHRPAAHAARKLAFPLNIGIPARHRWRAACRGGQAARRELG